MESFGEESPHFSKAIQGGDGPSSSTVCCGTWSDARNYGGHLLTCREIQPTMVRMAEERNTRKARFPGDFDKPQNYHPLDSTFLHEIIS